MSERVQEAPEGAGGDGGEQASGSGEAAAPREVASALAARRAWGRRVACAALAALAVGCLFYGIDRTRAALTEPAFDPLLIIESARIDYFWRAGISFFLAVTAFLGVLQWKGAGAPERPPQFFRGAMVAVAVASVLSAVFP